MSQRTGMRLSFFGGLRPFSRRGAVRDAMAGVTLASMNIPQVLGYTRIAATPVVTGLYTVLLPLVAFAVFGSSRHLVVAADSATAAIFSGSLSHMAEPASEKYMALVGMVALLTAGFLLLARVFKLGFLADFFYARCLSGFSLVSGFRSESRCWVTCSGSRSARSARLLRPGRSYRACRRSRLRHSGYPLWRRAAFCSATALPHACRLRCLGFTDGGLALGTEGDGGLHNSAGALLVGRRSDAADTVARGTCRAPLASHTDIFDRHITLVPWSMVGGLAVDLALGADEHGSVALSRLTGTGSEA
jgi:Sulfate permease family